MDEICKKDLDKLLQKLNQKDINEQELLRLKSSLEHVFSEDGNAGLFLHEIWETSSTEINPKLQESVFTDITNTISRKNAIDSISYNNKVRKYNPFVYLSIATSVAAVIFAGLFFFNIFANINNADVLDYVFRVENGQKAELNLPDGSKVYLNSASGLTYNSDYGHKNRHLKIEGEAYFVVAKDENNPFTVNANGVNIVALGTIFNVKSYAEDQKTSISLIEGKVKIENDDLEEFLYPSQRLEYTLNDKQIKISAIQTNANDMLWLHNELPFYGDSLEEICKMLSRMYNVEFIFRNENIKELKFSGLIKNSSLNNVLELLSVSSGTKFKRLNNDKIEIY